MYKIYLTTLFFSLFISCKNSEFYIISGNTQGTTYSIIYEGKFENLGNEIDSVLHIFDLSLSTYNQNSVISKINQNIDIEVDSLFLQMYYEALRVYKLSDGAFDITVAPLVNAYGFGFTQNNGAPGKNTIDSLMQFVGMEKISLERNKIIKKYPQIMLDPNAIAQGQSVDFVAKYLDTKGIKNYLIDIGGEIRAKGKKYGNNWIIGIDKPVDGNFEPGKNIQVKLSVSNLSLATSGDYRKFYIENGIKYSHTINPKTGFPARQNILSATIISENCITADALATACTVSGFEKSKALINNLKNTEAYFIYSDSSGAVQTYFTQGFKKYILE